MHKRLFIIPALLILLFSCGHKQSFSEKLAMRPVPQDAAGIQKECKWIQSEITKTKITGLVAKAQGAVWSIISTRKKKAALEKRAADLKCSTVSQPGVAAEEKPINDCIKACEEKTPQTPAQCFDSCK